MYFRVPGETDNYRQAVQWIKVGNYFIKRKKFDINVFRLPRLYMNLTRDQELGIREKENKLNQPQDAAFFVPEDNNLYSSLFFFTNIHPCPFYYKYSSLSCFTTILNFRRMDKIFLQHCQSLLSDFRKIYRGQELYMKCRESGSSFFSGSGSYFYSGPGSSFYSESGSRD